MTRRATFPTLLAIAALVLLGAAPLDAQPADAGATLLDAEGAVVGRVDLVSTPGGAILLRATLEGLPPGVHAFHIHETGVCTPPSFTSAGGHHAPHGRAHGVLSPEGRHAGDLPNVHVPSDGALTVEVFVDHASLKETERGLLDADGSAFVIHAGPDDYRTDPAGDAGPRIACGPITSR